MTEIACFLIKNRNDLIDLTKRLFGAIDDGFLENRDHPLRVSVNGTWASGKSLVAEAACLIFDDPAPLEGQLELYRSKRWSGMRHGKPIDLAMFNNVYDEFEEDQFRHDRKCGGIDFISNHPKSNKKSDLVICVERLGDAPLRYYPSQFSYFQASGENITELSLSKEWLRFVSIRVNNRKLLTSATFQETFNTLCPQKLLAGILSLAFRAMTDPSAKHFPSSFKNCLKKQILPFYDRGLPAERINP